MTVFKNQTLLDVVVERFQCCHQVDDIWVATTIERSDDAIAQWCADRNINCFRGSEEDVLDRVTHTAVQAGADGVVQMGADSVYLDFKLIDKLVNYFRTGRYDYVCNDMSLTFPLGVYGHVVKTKCLQTINARDDLEPADREDVVRYLWERPGEYTILNLSAPPRLHCPEMRLTVDYAADLALARRLYQYFDDMSFATEEIIAVYQAKPEWFQETTGLIQKQAPFLSTVVGYENIALAS